MNNTNVILTCTMAADYVKDSQPVITQGGIIKVIDEEFRYSNSSQGLLTVDMTQNDWDKLPSFGKKYYAPKGTQPGTKYKAEDGEYKVMGTHRISFQDRAGFVTSAIFNNVNIIDEVGE